MTIPRLTWQIGLALVLAGFVITFVIALYLANDRGAERVAIQDRTQEAQDDQLDKLRVRVWALEDEAKVLEAAAERARVQANTSVGQLVQAGQKPLIPAPEVVTISTQPVPTTAPPFCVVPATTPLPTTTVPTTTAPPETTTTTGPPPTSTTSPTTTTEVIAP